MRNQTIYEILEREHQEVAELLDKLVDDVDADEDERASVFQTLNASLSAHATAEEAVFYPALQELEEGRPLALEAREEHRIVKRLLGEIDGLARMGERWDAKVKVLKESVEHHVKEEEGEIFKLARAGLDQERARELGERFLAAKRVALREQAK